MEHANGADLIIYVVDSSVALDDNDYDIINFIKDKKAVILLNKSDLASNVSADDIKSLWIKLLFRFLQRKAWE